MAFVVGTACMCKRGGSLHRNGPTQRRFVSERVRIAMGDGEALIVEAEVKLAEVRTRITEDLWIPLKLYGLGTPLGRHRAKKKQSSCRQKRSPQN